MKAPVSLPWDYRSGFLDAVESERLLTRLVAGIEWRQESLRIFGRPTRVPRLVAWYGDPGLNYRYAGTDHVCDGWPEWLQPLRRRLVRAVGFTPNLVLINRYRDGADAMGWHRDDERGLDRRVASVSVGGTRRFLVRRPGHQRSDALELEAGSLLLLDGTLRHALPRTRRPVAERINLTFRRLEPG